MGAPFQALPQNMVHPPKREVRRIDFPRQQGSLPLLLLSLAPRRLAVQSIESFTWEYPPLTFHNHPFPIPFFTSIHLLFTWPEFTLLYTGKRNKSTVKLWQVYQPYGGQAPNTNPDINQKMLKEKTCFIFILNLKQTNKKHLHNIPHLDHCKHHHLHSTDRKTKARAEVDDLPQTRTYLREQIRRTSEFLPPAPSLSTADPIEILASSTSDCHYCFALARNCKSPSNWT